MGLNPFAAAAATFALSATAALAAPCTGVVEPNGIVVNAGCEVGGANNDSAGQVNADMLFGEDEWELLAKDNNLDGTDEGDASLLTVTGSLTAGVITIDESVFDDYDSVMIVLKGGGGSTTQANYIGYLVDENMLAGTDSTYLYATPFLNANNGNEKNISHVTLYGVTLAAVPVPAAGLMLLLGLGGLGAIRRKRAA